MLISEKMIHAAFDWLEANAEPAAAAKAQRIRAEHATKRMRARLFLESPKSSVAERDAWALDHPDYGAAVDTEAEAVEKDEAFRNQRSKCDAIIEAWRSEQANYRAMSKVA